MQGLPTAVRRLYDSGLQRERLIEYNLLDTKPPRKTGNESFPVHDLVIRYNLKKRPVHLLNSPPMVAGLRSYLFAAEVNVPKEIGKGSLVLSSDRQDGSFDIDRMLGMLSDAMPHALNEGYQGLWATGDMSWNLDPQYSEQLMG